MAESGESKRRVARKTQAASATVARPQRASGGLEAGLWLVATPIGNADDISIRAMRVLEHADVLVCEDTRQTRKLMVIHGIALNGRRMISYNDQNGAGRRPQVMQLLAEGHSVAYASDAGTPLIADPGYRLVEAAQEAGHSVHAVPGPSAVLAALSVAGLPTDRFLFLGFPPVKTAARRSELGEVAALRSTLVMFESPKRLGASLADAAAVLGSTRVAAVTRELTKKFEEVNRASLGQLADHYAQTMPKGEVVVVIGPPDAAAAQERYSAKDIDALLQTALETSSTKDAAKQVADRTGLPRREIYQRAVGISKDVH